MNKVTHAFRVQSESPETAQMIEDSLFSEMISKHDGLDEEIAEILVDLPNCIGDQIKSSVGFPCDMEQAF